MKSFVILPQKPELRDATYIRRCTVERYTDHKLESSDELWFEIENKVNQLDDSDCDSYVLAVIMDAMQEQREVHVKGEVSRTLLGNIEEFQSAWNKWLPELYHIVDIKVDVVNSDPVLPRNQAICAFSGGVDATFSVWRHHKKLAGYRSQNIRLSALVHGFDIPLNDNEAFENAFKRSESTLSDVDIPLVAIKTNYRLWSKVNWEHAFSTALVATLSNMKREADICIVGSSEPYDSLVIPWGSSPITDHLLSSSSFAVIHDGASHSRTEKVDEIANWQKGIDNLRVCWQGDLKDRNCGVCEKCLRTKLNFLATGNGIPKSLPGSDIHKALRGIVLKNDAVKEEWKQVLEHAKKNDINQSWVSEIPAILKRTDKTLAQRVFPEGSKRKAVAKSFIRRLKGQPQ
ncbi:hypothetical protein [Vibrio nigripulchritudo]|uniref:hypothetical protein n=1 Tax=Vibrio nigripulchritudo TaxID=28173 RepID=UPI0024939738|nr:hypothetical protein [Vibrio nigripulchritudo]BDU36505.1 hypothetical protein TUMSATVNIG2_09740 [Vibrio nigripulchritudo]BDU42162.1 hypothetical protein TUMSATVNIG3_09600 [Vibrio nigripulchritudo]